MKSVTLLHNGLELGDWKVLLLNDEVYYEGHSIPDHVWLNLLDDLGIICFDKMNLTNEELEKEAYG